MTDIAPPAKRPPLRLTAGLLWLVAAGLGVGGTFGDIISRTWPDFRLVTGFWQQTSFPDRGAKSSEVVLFGLPVVVAAAFMVLAFLVALLSVRRWAAVVAGTFGTGMMLDTPLSWYVSLWSGDNGDVQVELGLYLVTGAVAIALVALVLALSERPRRPAPAAPPFFRPPMPPRPPQAPPPPRRWEPETPKYGVPVQQPETPPTGQPAIPAVSEPEAPQPTSHLDTPERTTAIDPPEPGAISRKLDGDDK